MGVWPSILTNEAGQGVILDPGIRVCTTMAQMAKYGTEGQAKNIIACTIFV